MIFGLLNDKRVKAIPNLEANCPICKGKLISKCGEINIWHFAHKIAKNCDSFSEPESEFHFKWKNYFPEECQEVIIGKHRADIKTKKGLVIEIQNSPLSSKQIKEREEFYKNMIWILNGEKFKKNININTYPIKCKRFPKTWKFANKQIYIDMGEDLLLLKSFENNFIKISKIPLIIENGGVTW